MHPLAVSVRRMRKVQEVARSFTFIPFLFYLFKFPIFVILENKRLISNLNDGLAQICALEHSDKSLRHPLKPLGPRLLHFDFALCQNKKEIGLASDVLKNAIYLFDPLGHLSESFLVAICKSVDEESFDAKLLKDADGLDGGYERRRRIVIGCDGSTDGDPAKVGHVAPYSRTQLPSDLRRDQRQIRNGQ